MANDVSVRTNALCNSVKLENSARCRERREEKQAYLPGWVSRELKLLTFRAAKLSK